MSVKRDTSALMRSTELLRAIAQTHRNDGNEFGAGRTANAELAFATETRKGMSS